MLPTVTYHVECSLDGRIDWLKPDGFLYYRVIQDQTYDAMISGSNTILAAPMSQDERIEKILDQFLIVVDSQGKIRNWDLIKRQPHWNDTPIVLCSRRTPESYKCEAKANGVHCIVAGENRVALRAALEEVSERFGVKTIRIDSGGVLAGVFLRDGLVDEVSLLFSPQLTGGTSPKTIFTADDLDSIKNVVDLELKETRVVEGGRVWLQYRVINRKASG